MKIRSKPERDYVQEANYEQLLVVTRQWQSDLAFYKDELRFLQNLLDKYFMLLVNDNNSAQLQELIEKLQDLNKDQQELTEDMKKHLHRLEQLIENTYTGDHEKFHDNHEDLGEDFVEFVGEFRKYKKEVFSVTEEILESEKLKHLLAK